MTAELGLVYASRDDDYADGVNDRLVRSIKSIQRLARFLNISLDVVVVDWNSPLNGGLPKLLSTRSVRGVKVVSVGPDLAEVLGPLSARPFLEYPAKNVGLLHVDAHQVLVLNPDITINESLLHACTARPYLGDSFLRSDRTDFRRALFRTRVPLRRHIRHGESQSDSITLFPSRTRRIRGGTNPLPGEVLMDRFIVGPPGGLKEHFLAGMHTNTSGDFICTGRSNWLNAGGFAQNRWLSVMGDALMVARLVSLNLRQVIFSGPGLWHEDHPSDPSRGGSWSADMWPAFLDELMAAIVSDQMPLGSEIFKGEVPIVHYLD